MIEGPPKYLYWVIFGFMMLLYSAVIYHNKKDTNKQYYMMFGLTISLYTHYPRTIFIIISSLALTYVLSLVISKYDKYYQANRSFVWVFYGFYVISPLIGMVVLITSILYIYLTQKFNNSPINNMYYNILLFSMYVSLF